METNTSAHIAEIKTRLDGHDAAIERHERHLGKLDEAVTMLRETIGRVATKDDILDLRKDINQTHAKQMADAQNSIPGKFAALFAGGSLLVALAAFVFEWAVKSHG